MLHTITVRAGENDLFSAAHEHAIELARKFDARLNVAHVLEPGAEEAHGPEASAVIDADARAEFAPVEARAGSVGVQAAVDIRREGIKDGLLTAAAESDLIVLPLPEEADQSQDEEAVDDHLEVVRSAEAAVLTVSAPPQEWSRVFVEYRGGIPGKSALRLAGELATRCEAVLVIDCVHGDVAEAGRLTNIAERYYQGFPRLTFESWPRSGVTESETAVIDAAGEAGADLLVVGGEPYGALDRIVQSPTPEDYARKTNLPVLIAR